MKACVLPFIHTSDLVRKSRLVIHSWSYGCFLAIIVCKMGNWLCSLSRKLSSLLIPWNKHTFLHFIESKIESFSCLDSSTIFICRFVGKEWQYQTQTSISLTVASILMLMLLSFSTLFLFSSKVIFSFILKMSTSLSRPFSVSSNFPILRMIRMITAWFV